MLLLTVTSKKLNKRKAPVSEFTDKKGIVKTVKKGFTFEGEAVMFGSVKWYKDKDGFYYWGGGITESARDEISTEPAIGENKTVSASSETKIESDRKENKTESVDEKNKMESRPIENKVIIEKIAAQKNWGFEDFRIEELWKFSRGKEIKVALLDSGLNTDVADFKNKPGITYYNATSGSEKKEDCIDDQFYHGTNCAGILCGQGVNVFGIAPDIQLLVIKITNSENERTSRAILAGLRKAIDARADVISISSYIHHDENFEGIHNAIRDAYGKNITITACAGDGGDSGRPIDNYPASFPECLSIGGITKNRMRSKASVSSHFLDLMAPGEDITAPANPASVLRGTGFATPFAAGVIALLKSIAVVKHIQLTNILLYDILKRSSDTKTPPDYNILEYGWGILDPVAALQLLSHT